MDMSLSALWQIVKNRRALCAIVHRVAESWTRLSNQRTMATKISKLGNLKKESFINAPAFTSQLGGTSDLDWGWLISAGLLFESIISWWGSWGQLGASQCLAGLGWPQHE